MTPNQARALTFRDCCRIIIDDYNRMKINGHYTKQLDYAFGYASAGLDLSGDAARIQASYIICNLSHWRHADAGVIRARLRMIAEGK